MKITHTHSQPPQNPEREREDFWSVFDVSLLATTFKMPNKYQYYGPDLLPFFFCVGSGGWFLRRGLTRVG